MAKTRKREIRHRIKEGGQIPEDSHAHETSGVEELMIYLSTNLLIKSGLLTENATIIVPNPELTPWGAITETSVWKSVGESLLIPAASIRSQLNIITIHAYGRNIRGGADAAGSSLIYLVYNKLKNNEPQPQIMNEDGNTRLLNEYVIDLLKSQIPGDLKPRLEEIQQFNINTLAKFKELIRMFGYRTRNLLRAFHAYRTAFADVSSEVSFIGRTLKWQELPKISYSLRSKNTKD